MYGSSAPLVWTPRGYSASIYLFFCWGRSNNRHLFVYLDLFFVCLLFFCSANFVSESVCLFVCLFVCLLVCFFILRRIGKSKPHFHVPMSCVNLTYSSRCNITTSWCYYWRLGTLTRPDLTWPPRGASAVDFVSGSVFCLLFYVFGQSCSWICFRCLLLLLLWLLFLFVCCCFLVWSILFIQHLLYEWCRAHPPRTRTWCSGPQKQHFPDPLRIPAPSWRHKTNPLPVWVLCKGTAVLKGFTLPGPF